MGEKMARTEQARQISSRDMEPVDLGSDEMVIGADVSWLFVPLRRIWNRRRR